MREVVVVSAVRTAIGTFGGSLKEIPPTQLGAMVVREALARAGVDGAEVGHVVFGNVVHTEPRDMYLGRVAAIVTDATRSRLPQSGAWAAPEHLDDGGGHRCAPGSCSPSAGSPPCCRRSSPSPPTRSRGPR